MMDYQHLLSTLLMNAHFESRDDAEQALATALETLAYMLSPEIVDELQETLPRECAVALALGLTLRLSEGSWVDRAAPQRLLGGLPYFTVDRIRGVCAVLAVVLGQSLVDRITAQLPARLNGAFVRPQHDQALYELASRGPGRVTTRPSLKETQRGRAAPSGGQGAPVSSLPVAARARAGAWDSGTDSNRDTRRMRRL